MTEVSVWRRTKRASSGAEFLKSKSNFPQHRFLIFHIIFISPRFLFLPAELLSACHELRCRYGCVMTRNGTFCFCADGFEVGEDGTSCRGKTFGAAGGGPHCHGEQAPAPPSPLGLTSIKSFLKKWKRNRTCRRRSLCENHLSAGVYGALHPPTRQHSQNAIIPDLFCCRFFYFVNACVCDSQEEDNALLSKVPPER